MQAPNKWDNSNPMKEEELKEFFFILWSGKKLDQLKVMEWKQNIADFNSPKK